MTDVDPALLGRWWSFLVMSIVVYGLVPRGLSALVAGGCLERAVARAFVGHPQARTLLERLAPAPVETRAADPPERADTGEAPPSMFEWPPLDPGGLLFNWSRVPVDDARLARALGGESVHHAGGTESIAAERDLVARLAASSRGGVAVVCKAWEPPVLELDDFLHALRTAGLGPVRVVPVRVEAGVLAPATATEVRVWQRAFTVSEAVLASLPVNHG